MSIDCEGHDLSVLKSNNFSKFRPRMLIVEDHEGMGHTPIHSYCLGLGFKLSSIVNVSRLYVDGSTFKSDGRNP
jgi:hypothetical protein